MTADVMIIDGSDAELSNSAVIREIAVSQKTDVLLLMPKKLDGNVLRALSAGAVGILPMDAGAGELVAAIRLIAAGHGYLDPIAIRPLVRTAAHQDVEQTLTADDRFAKVLTTREKQVLTYVGQGMSNADIAQRLTVSENTVKTHVSRVLSKLRLRSRVEAALAVRNSWSHQECETVPRYD
ncbi:LuxR C-terminal-related transcriptional regulator [Streptomyces sp. NPDC059063]|uniref:LuxR C-terminal-related transcriptional regulator n=1 Tax=Streptomyces sp. NPDC059063 TaxID=3346712 RepID=UPI003688BFAC